MKSNTSGPGISGRIFFAVLTLMVVLGWPQVSLSMELDGESGYFLLEDTVVTGTRRDRVIADAPIRTEVITSEDIEVNGNATLYEILESTPGIRVEQQCSYCGFSQVRMQGLESGHVQILVDGQPIFSGLAGVYGLDQIPAGSIEKVEVVKGASSALYGPQSIGGVINIITKRPGKEHYMKVGSEFGAHKTHRYYGEAAVSKGDSDILVTATHWDKGPIDENEDGIWDRVESTNTNVGLGVNYYNLLGEDHLTLKGRFSTEARKGGEVETYDNPFAESAEHIDTNRIESSLMYSIRFSNGGELLTNVAFADHERSATNDTFVGDYLDINGDYPGPDLLRPYEAYEDLYVADANYSHPIGERMQLLLGAQYSYNTLEETGMYVIVDPLDQNLGEAYESKSEKWAKELGVYTQVEYTAIEDTLEIVVGARWDSHESEDEFRGSGSVALIDVAPSRLDEEMWNPRVGLMFRPDDHLTIRAAVGTGFRVPYGFSEELHLCSGSPRVSKPADLEPERSVSYSLSGDYRTETVVLGLSYFNTEVEDKIGLSDASQRARELNYDYQWENLGKATSKGAEFESRFILPYNLDLTGWVTYTDAKYDEARPDWVDNPTHGNRYRDDSVYISRIPEWEGSVGATWSPANMIFNLSLNYTGSMYIDYYQDEDPEAANSKIKHTAPFWTVNTRLAYKFEEHWLTMFVGGKNIFDEVQDERHPDDAAFIYAPLYGRILYGGIEFEF